MDSTATPNPATPTAAPAPAAPATPAKPARPAHARLCIVLLVLLGFALGCSEFVVIGIEPELARDFGVSLAQVGQLISLFSITYAVLTPILALVTGRFRRFQLLVAYSVVFVLGNLAAMLAPTFEVLLASRVLLGACSGGLLAVGVTCIPELVGSDRVSMTISVVYAAFAMAMVVVTSVGRLVASYLDWHVAMAGTLVLAAASCVALAAVFPRTGATDEPATASEQFGLLRESCVLSGIAIFVFGVGAVYVFYGYITPYLEDVLGMTPVAASAVLMAYGGVCLVSNLASGVVDSRFGMRGLLVTFPLLAAALATLWALGPSMPWALVVVLCIGLLMYIVSVPCISMFMDTATRRHPKALTLASSIEPASFNIGIAFGTAVGGAVVSGPGMRFVGLVGAAFALLACALVALSLRLARRSREA